MPKPIQLTSCPAFTSRTASCRLSFRANPAGLKSATRFS